MSLALTTTHENGIFRGVSLPILLANLLQSSRSTFSRGSFLSFFAFQEGMFDTPISVLGVGQQYLSLL